MAEAVIRVEKLVHVYPRGNVKALKGIDLDIRKGEIFGIGGLSYPLWGRTAVAKPPWCAISTACCGPQRAKCT